MLSLESPQNLKTPRESAHKTLLGPLDPLLGLQIKNFVDHCYKKKC